MMINTSCEPEDIVLRYSARHMDALRPYLAAHFYRDAASRLLNLKERTIFLTTGFYVAGVCETDGPPGTLCAALTLKALGYKPVIVTDTLCRGLFETTQLPVIYAPMDADDTYWHRLLSEWHPAAMIAIERCGKNTDGDYANMRGESIASYTAPIDRMFELAVEAGIYTIGIGDGGNEIGMGNLTDALKKHTSLNPCIVRTDDLLIGTTSNWGAYALSAALARETGRPDSMPEYRYIAVYISRLAEQGCVDGISRQPINRVDGFPPETEEEIYQDLKAYAERGYSDI